MEEKNSLIERIRIRPMAIYGSSSKDGAVEAIKTVVNDLLKSSESVKVWIDDDFINVKTFNTDAKLLWIWRYNSIERKEDMYYGKLQIEAVCEHLICNVDLQGTAEHVVEMTEYIEGNHIKTETRISQSIDKNTIHLKFKISHEVFEFDTITKEDLNFIQIGE